MDRRSDRPLSHVRGVSFDLFFTLAVDTDTERMWSLRSKRLQEVLGVDGEAVRAAVTEAHGRHHEAWDQQRALPFHELCSQVLRAAGHEVDPEDDLVRQVAEALDEPTREVGLDVCDDGRAAVLRLAEAGLPVALVCDTAFSSGHALRDVLDDEGLLDAFAVTVFSEEVAQAKPHERPFRTMLDSIGLPGPAVVHVGDLRRKDVAGAVALGLEAVRYRGMRDDAERDPELPDAEIVIDDHAELLDLLGLG